MKDLEEEAEAKQKQLEDNERRYVAALIYNSRIQQYCMFYPY